MEEEHKTSAFNQAQLQIQRLDNTWNKCIKNREQNDLSKYRKNLMSAEIELLFDARKIDSEQNKQYVNQLKDANKKIYEAIGNFQIFKVWEFLEKKEIILREIQEESGKGSMWKDEFEDEMD